MQQFYLPSSTISTSSILDTLGSHLKSIDISFIRLNEPSKMRGRVSHGFFSHTNQTPERGVTRLPDELLTDIFLLSTNSLFETKTLSHVCRRFRRVVLSSKRVWRRFPLHSGWSLEQILTVAERCGFEGIEARISGNGNVTRGKCWYGSANDELKAAETILSLYRGLETLEVTRANEACLELAQSVLHGSTLPSLRKLVVLRSSPSPSPSPECKQFYDTCSFPQLEELRADFCPRPALATNLVRCTLYIPRVLHLRSYLDFLSSAPKLRELHLWFSAREEQLVLPSSSEEENRDKMEPITLQSLETLEIHYSCPSSAPSSGSDTLPPLLVSSIILPALRRLVLSTNWLSLEVKPFLDFLHPTRSPGVKVLVLELCHLGKKLDFGRLLETIEEMETSVEMLEVKTRNELVFSSSSDLESSLSGGIDNAKQPFRPPNNLRRILLTSDYTPVSETFLRHLRGYLLSSFPGADNNKLQIEFRECRGVEDGVYTLDTLEDVVESMSISRRRRRGC